MRTGSAIAAIALASSLAVFATGCDRSAEDDTVTDAQPDTRTDMQPGTATDMPRDAQEPADAAAGSAESATSRAGQAVDDAFITTSVKSKYLADDTLKGFDISVDTEQGVVMLTGTVQSEAAKDRASQIAQTVDGVVSVNNQLTVGGS